MRGYADSIDVFSSNGDGTFSARRSYLAGNYAGDVAALDLDGKNQLDFVIVGYEMMSVMLDACP